MCKLIVRELRIRIIHKCFPPGFDCNHISLYPNSFNLTDHYREEFEKFRIFLLQKTADNFRVKFVIFPGEKVVLALLRS